MITFESFELFSILMTISAASLNVSDRRAPADYKTSAKKTQPTSSASETNRLLVRNDYADTNHRLKRQPPCSKLKDISPGAYR